MSHNHLPFLCLLSIIGAIGLAHPTHAAVEFKGLLRINTTIQTHSVAQPWELKQPSRRRGLGAVLEDGNILQSDDRYLCQNNLFWRDVNCDVNRDIFGSRCHGSVQQCVYPWYYNSDGWQFSNLLQYCSDHSDQIMYQQSFCPDHAVYLQVHNDISRNEVAKHYKNESWFSEITNEKEYYNQDYSFKEISMLFNGQ